MSPTVDMMQLLCYHDSNLGLFFIFGLEVCYRMKNKGLLLYQINDDMAILLDYTKDIHSLRISLITLRDRPFLVPGTRAERIYENLKKIFILHENTMNIFRTSSKSG